MHFKLIAVVLGAAAQVLAQTPPGTSPSTNSNVGVTYGTTKVTPGLRLSKADTALIPKFSFTPKSASQLYSLLLVDLSIRKTQVNTSQLSPQVLPLPNGVASDRTTRLHFFQTNITFATNGTLLNNSRPIAYYNPPSPPAGDIAHTYAFYLFEQTANYTGPNATSPFNVANVNASPNNRYGITVDRFSGGALVGGNYILVQTPNDTTTSSTTARPSTVTAVGTVRPTSTTTARATGTATIVAFNRSNDAASLLGAPFIEGSSLLPSRGVMSTLAFAVGAAAAVAFAI